MNTSDLNWLTLVLVTGLFACEVGRAANDESAKLIFPADPRFEVLELSNSEGDGTYASPIGTVVLTFASKDSRYCRAARFSADYTFVLACREEQGWKIEAASRLAPGDSTNMTAVGGGDMRAISDAVEALRAGPDFLHGPEIVEAASKGWRNPSPVDEYSLDARQILKRTGQVYRASKSYIDSGTVQTVYTSPSREWTGETYFRTAYAAPFDFRFESNMHEFQSLVVDYIVWRDRDGVKSWSSLKPDRVEEVPSIQRAIDTGAGISRDSSGMIPGLIFPGSKLGGDIIRLTSAERLEDEQIDGFDCFKVQGFRWPNTGKPTIVWIDQDSFLIRKVYEEGKARDAVTRTTWSYEPEINVPVDEAALELAKPTAQ